MQPGGEAPRLRADDGRGEQGACARRPVTTEPPRKRRGRSLGRARRRHHDRPRATARSSCDLFIVERPSIPSRFATAYSCSFVRPSPDPFEVERLFEPEAPVPEAPVREVDLDRWLELDRGLDEEDVRDPEDDD